MTANEINWLIQTIEDRETAMRFVQAQYEVGRIPRHVMAELAREHGWTDCPQFKSSTTEMPNFISIPSSGPFEWCISR